MTGKDRIGARVAGLRKGRGLSQIGVARRAGVSHSLLSRSKRVMCRPSPNRLRAAAGRLLAGQPVASGGALTIVAPAAEAGVHRMACSNGTPT
jgi:transcriptional regulator with XRE-family HTH domain